MFRAARATTASSLRLGAGALMLALVGCASLPEPVMRTPTTVLTDTGDRRIRDLIHVLRRFADDAHAEFDAREEVAGR